MLTCKDRFSANMTVYLYNCSCTELSSVCGLLLLPLALDVSIFLFFER